jgi:CheY-like chemotaxis protein
MKLQANSKPTASLKSRWDIRSWLLGRRDAETAPDPESAQPEPVLPADAKRILVVDDDEIIRTTTARKLKSHGYAVSTAADGPTAIHAARCERPDLILLDLNFPADLSLTWDGFSIMKWLRRLDVTKHIPIIILTGSREADLTKRIQSAGAEGLFNKPVSFEPLVGLIEARLRQHAAPAR